MGLISKFIKMGESLLVFAGTTGKQATTMQQMQAHMKQESDTVGHITESILWQPSTTYAVGKLIISPNMPAGYIAECTTAGQSGSTEPAWSGNYTSFTDGTVKWDFHQLRDYNALKNKPNVQAVPSSMKNPYALTISLNGTSQGAYDGSAAKAINITPASIGALTSAGKAANATYADTAGRAYPYKVGGTAINFNWSGKDGQPTWLWGGENGTDMYVYKPSNFSVASAATSTKATGDESGNNIKSSYAASLTHTKESKSGDVYYYFSLISKSGAVLSKVNYRTDYYSCGA